MGKCLDCKHWGGNGRASTGRCFCNGNPHYYNNDILTADDGCGSWERHPSIKTDEEARREMERYEREFEEKERQRKALEEYEKRKYKEWLASPEGQSWQRRDKAKKKRAPFIRCIIGGIIGFILSFIARTGGDEFVVMVFSVGVVIIVV